MVEFLCQMSLLGKLMKHQFKAISCGNQLWQQIMTELVTKLDSDEQLNMPESSHTEICHKIV